MIKCQTCAYENKEGAQFCLNCGAPLTKQKLSEAVDDVSEDATIMLDPAAMQRRMQEEFQQQQQAKTPEKPKTPTPAPAPAPPPAPAQKAPAPPPPPSPAPQPQQAAPPPQQQQQSTPSPSPAPGGIVLSRLQFLLIVASNIVLFVLVLILLFVR